MAVHHAVQFTALRVAPAVRGDWRKNSGEKDGEIDPGRRRRMRVLIELAGDDPSREGLI
jgi:hypothetical protein